MAESKSFGRLIAICNGTKYPQDIMTYLKELLGTENYNAAFVLKRLLFWSDHKRKNGKMFFYKSNKDLANDLALTVQQVKDCKKILKHKCFIECDNSLANGRPTTHYRVFLDHIEDKLEAHLKGKDNE